MCFEGAKQANDAKKVLSLFSNFISISEGTCITFFLENVQIDEIRTGISGFSEQMLSAHRFISSGLNFNQEICIKLFSETLLHEVSLFDF